jgi:hypothetical protein
MLTAIFDRDGIEFSINHPALFATADIPLSVLRDIHETHTLGFWVRPFFVLLPNL